MTTLATCARCWFTYPAKEMLHSRHTNLYYCFNTKECDFRHINNLSNAEIIRLGEQSLKKITYSPK